jgi:hypothetical protein
MTKTKLLTKKRNNRKSNQNTSSKRVIKVLGTKNVPSMCGDPDMTFSECELAILRTQVDQAQEKQAKRVVQSKDISEIIKITEDFIKDKKLICYGGTAINNILPVSDQFYDKSRDLADYDFFTANAVSDAKELADIYAERGFTEVEAKSGQHYGTYKVFVNYIPVADVTSIPQELFDTLSENAIKRGGILYAPPNFLRMSMYLELSRPSGDTDRWEKVMKRLTLLNKHYPLDYNSCKSKIRKVNSIDNSIKQLVVETLADKEVVFFGGVAFSKYLKHNRNNNKQVSNHSNICLVIARDSDKVAKELKDELNNNEKIKKKESVVEIVKHANVGEIVPVHYEVQVDGDAIAFIYEPTACHSYNIVMDKDTKLKIATIDTMLSFYLAFLFTDREYYNEISNSILCIAHFLYTLQKQNRLEQKGVLKRFSITCYGHQPTIEEIRANKSKKFNELRSKRNSKEYESWFLSYSPGKNKTKSKTKSKTSTKEKTTSKSKTKSNSTTRKKSKVSSKKK